MSIRITTTDAIDALLARERKYITGVLAGSVEGLLPEDCDHRPKRQSCARCDERQAVITEATGLIRKIGGVP